MNDITDKEFESIRSYVKKNFGINLNDERRSLVYSRLRSVVAEQGFNNFTQYFEHLLKDRTGAEMKKFVNKITTNHTFFMREPDHFFYFQDVVLPKIVGNKPNGDLRLWCAASSSGEEPYTLMMVILDFFKNKPGWDTKILATDLSSNVLDKAMRGVYTTESISSLPQEWQRKYFTKHDETTSIVSNELKSKILFRKFNLMDDFPFKTQLNVIFARNVMIYFDNPTRNSVVEKFYKHTANGGYLFIGHSESLSHTATEYKYIMPAVYGKNV